MMKNFNYPQKIKIGGSVFNKVGWDVSFPNGKKLVRAIYEDAVTGKMKYLRDEKFLEGVESGQIIKL